MLIWISTLKVLYNPYKFIGHFSFFVKKVNLKKKLNLEINLFRKDEIFEFVSN